MDFEKLLKIGEVSKLLGLSPETLRFFDKEKIAVPQKSNNNYRYYEDWEINYLIEYKKYRGFGFSKNDTKDILYKYSFDELVNALDGNGERLQKELEYMQLLLKKNNETMNDLKELKNKIGRFSSVITEDVYYIKFRYNNQYFNNKENDSIYHEWLDKMPLVEPILLVNIPQQTDYYCGLSVTGEYLKILNLATDEKVLHSPGGLHINTVIVAGKKNTFSTELLNPTYNYIRKQGYYVNGPIIGYYRARVQSEDEFEYQRYIEIFVPVAKK